MTAHTAKTNSILGVTYCLISLTILISIWIPLHGWYRTRYQIQNEISDIINQNSRWKWIPLITRERSWFYLLNKANTKWNPIYEFHQNNSLGMYLHRHTSYLISGIASRTFDENSFPLPTQISKHPSKPPTLSRPIIWQLSSTNLLLKLTNNSWKGRPNSLLSLTK